MELLDQDIQMIRDALAIAPEYVKGHFESLVEQREASASRIEDLEAECRKLRDEENAQIGEIQDELDKAEDALDDVQGEGSLAALEFVRYWMHDILYLKRLAGDPRKILRIVDEALGY